MRLWFFGFLFFISRWIWEWIYTMDPSQSKGVFYFRDIFTFLPATLFWYFAILRSKPEKFQSRIWLYIYRFTEWLTNRPILSSLLLTIAIIFACSAINIFIFKTRAHIFDEAVYLFQAKIFASKKLWVNPPPVELADFFKFNYVVCTSSKWYGAFFPGQSIVLSVGILLGVPFLINPILSGILLILTVWAGCRLFDQTTGLLAGMLMLLSPFALLQGASYFSHVLTAIFFIIPIVWTLESTLLNSTKSIGIGLCGGVVLLSRPLSALILGMFITGWWAYQAITNQWDLFNTIRRLILVIVGSLPGVLFICVYNRLLTGNTFITPHQVALPNEVIGFGFHSIQNTFINLTGLSVDLLGISFCSFIPIIAYVYSRGESCVKPLMVLVILYILGYSMYPYHGFSYGPRFYFEVLPILLIASSRGILLLPGILCRWLALPLSWAKQSVYKFCIVGIVISLLGVIPTRLYVFHQRGEYYDIQSLINQSIQKPAVVFIAGADTPEERLYPYIAGFQLNNISLNSEIVFAHDLGALNNKLLLFYPDRNVYRLNMDNRQVRLYVAD